MEMIAELIAREEPDLIALQEVTEPLALLLLSHPCMRKYFCTSFDHLPTHPDCPSGLMLLSLWPLEEPFLHALPSNAGRNFVCAQVRWPTRSGEPRCFMFGTFHLESSPRDSDMRAQQAARIGELCTLTDLCVLCGDTNVKQDPQPLSFGLFEVDAWSAAREGDGGATRGAGVVPVNIPKSWSGGGDYRMDRILVTGTARVREARLVGDVPQMQGSKRVWMSDHLGVLAWIEGDV